VGVTGRRRFMGLMGAGGLSMTLHCRARSATAARVIVVGGGFAGSTCARYLRQGAPGIEVVLVDPDNHYVTCPMSNAVLTGLRSLKSITVTRDGLGRNGVRYIRERVTEIDAQRLRVRLSGGSHLAYDRLVVAPGIRFLWGSPQGYDEAASQRMPHAWVAGAQTELLAAQLRNMRNGGVVAISVPAGPMRCPPGPFERASLIAAWLKQHKPRSKVLIFDANNHFPKQDVFQDFWQRLYPGMVQWIPVVENGEVQRVDPARMAFQTAGGEHTADVINIIPRQAPGSIAMEAGLASARGWCPVNPRTFESTLVPGIHVIGDACIADPMPKAGSAAHAQGKACARAVLEALAGRRAADASFESVCYSLVAAQEALSIHGSYRSSAAGFQQWAAAGEISSPSGAQEALNARAWYDGIIADAFGSNSPGPV
jgi:sulfide dehydrogenase [flavocytochrome c] flavoprotein chain